jgi:thymidylate kinase
MNKTAIFNFIFEELNKRNIDYVILHSYQKFPYHFDSDIDTAVVVDNIKEAIDLLDNILIGTGWRIIQFWRHENYAADCVISNNKEFLQVDFCIHYERNGRVILPVQELVQGRKMQGNFYVPCSITEFTYVLLKKILKKEFSKGSKEQLFNLISGMSEDEIEKLNISLKRFFTQKEILDFLAKIRSQEFSEINLKELHENLLKNTYSLVDDLHYKFFDVKRKLERIIHPTGLFVVLLGVDGAGKTTIATQLKKEYAIAFRRIKHYHSRVRVLNDISQIKKDAGPIDASNPHSKKKQAGKVVSILKFAYYYADFLIGNIIITVAKIKSSLVLIERYYYDYFIDKVRYNLNLSNRFLRFFLRFILKPDVIFILTGDSNELLKRKNEISLKEIDEQKKRMEELFAKHPKAIFIDTTKNTVEENVAEMVEKCNSIMRGKRKWKKKEFEC